MTKDPKTGWINLGNYSAHIFGRAKALWEINRGNHGWIHWLNAKELGKDLECAIIIGGPPVLFYVGAAKIPAMVDELDIAGGLTGEPIEVVKCKTVDLEVPANAEIVIEGRISTKKMEPGNAFGEYTGYMATEVFLRPVIDVTCITHRRDPIFVHIMSQMPPSESSKVRQISSENLYYKFLKYDCKIPGIIDVAWHEISQAQWCVIQMKKTNNTDPWRVLHLAAGYDARWGKFFITVDEDIDPRDIDSVIWALSWRVQPKRDVEIIGGRFAGLDISAYRPDAPYTEKEMPNITGSSAILIDATMKWPYPPVSLPKREFMENALKIWKEIGLPELKLKQPWFGYNLGHWTKENEEDAEDILRGDFESVGKRLEEKAGRLSSSNSTSTF
jgi:4-hydroxy-3-polyprenylbenzoate decarboxylase